MSNELTLTPEQQRQARLDKLSKQLISCFPELEKAPKQELQMVMATCDKHKLNPFLKEVYLVKMGNKLAPIVNYITLANRVRAKYPLLQEKWHYKFNDQSGNIERCMISLCLEGQPLVQQIVFMKEYTKSTTTWKNMPNTMIQKVARAQAYRMIDSEFQDLYIQEEMESDKNKVITPQNKPLPIEEIPHEEINTLKDEWNLNETKNLKTSADVHKYIKALTERETNDRK